MGELYYVYGTAAVIVALFVAQVLRKTFDPFAPIWMFLLGYAQVYVVQAISYHDYALRARGAELVATANARALWALLWFLLVYHSGVGKVIARCLPRAPAHWSPSLIAGVTPPMIVWGLICSGLMLTLSENDQISAEGNLLRQFPIMLLAAGILLIVTGQMPPRRNPAMTWLGVAIAAFYVVVWMFNGKRSHSVIGVMTGVCAFYTARGKRPSFPVLAATACIGAAVVTLSLGWRNNYHYDRSVSGFVQYLGDFQVSSILVNLNMKERSDVDPDEKPIVSKETEEYGGFLLMMDTVPLKSAYDYGASYIRLVSTFIPRFLWPDKPLYGRAEWISAWIAGSEFKRDQTFTGPAISVLGAAQLNGGAIGTVLVLAWLALLLRTAYEYFRLYAATPWAQAWWALTYYNAWLMTVNDDPFVWFYYIYGFTILPPMLGLWLYHRFSAPSEFSPYPTAHPEWSAATCQQGPLA